MAAEPLLRRLQADDEVLQRELRTDGEGSSALAVDAQEMLLRMEQTTRELRAVSAALPSEQRAAALRRCENYERQLARHSAILQSRAENVARGQLVGGGGSRKQRPTSKDENDRVEMLKLSEARDQLRMEYERMGTVAEHLESSSNNIGKIKDQYHVYQSKLDYASQKLGQLKRKTEEDSRYIWWSFCFYMAVVAYIFLKRMKVFRLIYLGISWTFWSGTTAVGFAQGGVTWLAGVYQGFCELFGIPSAFDKQSV